MLRGTKVLLRLMQEDDIQRHHEFNQDPELYVLDSDYPRVCGIGSARIFYESRTKFSEDMAGFAIEADGKYIGSCELTGLQNRYGNVELGIQIGEKEYWGQGYGREAVNLLLDYGFRYCGVRRIFLTTNAKNERAIRCFQACGFIEEGRPRKVLWIDGGYTDLVNMSILWEEWQAQREKQTEE